MKYDLIIFDCDGVLVDSEPIANRTFAELIHELGFKISYDECKNIFTGRSDSDCLKLLEKLSGLPPPSNLFEEFDKRAFLRYEQELKAIKGIPELISLLKYNNFCVASNAPEAKVHKVLSVTGLFDHFHGKIFTSTMVERPKPYPDLFLFAARSMNAKPGRSVVIEDTVYGVRAAVLAEMDVFGYATERSNSEQLREAGAIVFNNMLDLAHLLEIVS